MIVCEDEIRDPIIKEKIEKLAELNIVSEIKIIKQSEKEVEILILNETPEKDNPPAQFYDEKELQKRKAILYGMRLYIRKVLFTANKDHKIVVFLNFSRFFKFQIFLTIGLLILPVVRKLFEIVLKIQDNLTPTHTWTLYLLGTFIIVVKMIIPTIIASKKIYEPILGNSNISYRFCWK